MGNTSSSDESDDENYHMRRKESKLTSLDVVNADRWTCGSLNASEYETIKQNLLEKRKQKCHEMALYVDESFPATSSSLFKEGMSYPEQWDKIIWIRPKAIRKRPRLYCDGISSEDICQGMVGNCWWLSAVASISTSARQMKTIIPRGQPCFNETGYIGAFHFRFWQFGRWYDFTVDDRLPVIGGRLCFGESPNRDEFWLPLLEKAYAKANGCYKALDFGVCKDALEDLTGGLAVTYQLGDRTPKHLRTIISKAIRSKTFICAAIHGDGSNEVDQATGLVSSHAYAILHFAKVHLTSGLNEYLIKIRNPWGGIYEWKQKYSDSSPSWDLVSEEDKLLLDISDDDDGEWWMTYEDFTRHFNDVTVCMFGQECGCDEDVDPQDEVSQESWKVETTKSSWLGDPNTGGSINNIKLYAKNPQYRLDILKNSDVTDSTDSTYSLHQDKAAVVIGLMQNNMSKNKLPISVDVYQAPPSTTHKLNRDYFKRATAGGKRQRGLLATSGLYKQVREVSVTTQLPPGCYVIIPSCFQPEHAAEFLIRVFSENNMVMKELLQAGDGNDEPTVATSVSELAKSSFGSILL